MALNFLLGYAHYPGLSTTGIFYEDDEGQRFVRWRPAPNLIPPPVNPIPIICCSSKGLVVWRDNFGPMSLYYISNPFNALPYACMPLLPPPRPHHPHNTHSVLAVTISGFHLVCAVLENPGVYIFDTYSSNNGLWRSLEYILVHEIVPNSGVSCGASAYWLIRMPGVQNSVLRFNPMGMDASQMISVIHLPYQIPLGARMQLGRTGRSLILAAVNEPMSRVELYDLQVSSQGNYQFVQSLFFLNVELRVHEDCDPAANDPNAKWWNKKGIICREMPRPIRFESFKLEVLLWVDGRVVVWENNTLVHGLRLTSVISDVPVRVTDGIPYIRKPSLLPWKLIL